MKMFLAGLAGILSSIALSVGANDVGGALGSATFALAVWGGLEKRSAARKRD